MDILNGFSPIGAVKLGMLPVLPTVYDESLSYYEQLCKLVNKMNEIINVINYLDPGGDTPDYTSDITKLKDFDSTFKNQVGSSADHTTINDREIVVVDENGVPYGSGIKSSDVMIRPNNAGRGTIAVFGTGGQLIPTSFDSETAFLTIDKLLATKHKAFESDHINIGTYNGLTIYTGKVTCTLNALTANGNIYGQTITSNITGGSFENVTFTDTPFVAFGASDDNNAIAWISEATVGTSGITKLRFSSYQNASVTVTIPYIAIGHREVSY